MKTAIRRTSRIMMAVFLCAVFCMLTNISEGYAEEYFVDGGEGVILKYSTYLDEEGAHALICGRDQRAGDQNLQMTIPATIDDYWSVESLEQGAFLGDEALVSVVLGDGIKRICPDVLAQCPNLKTVYVPDSVTSIGEGSFVSCDQLVLCGEEDSAIQEYAEANGIPYETAGTPAVETVETIVKKEQEISCRTSLTGVCGKTYKLYPKAKTPVTFKSTKGKVASVTADGKVTLKSPGRTEIMIYAEKNEYYKASLMTVDVKVTPRKPAFKAVNIKGNSIKLTWDKVPYADGYKLYVYDPSSGKFKCRLTKSANVKSVTHRGLVKGQVYKYKVRAFTKVKKSLICGPYSKVQIIKVKK